MIITQTPLRISLAGGGTDLRSFYAHDVGSVVSSAIDKYIYVIVKERFDRKIYVNYSRREIVDHVDEIRHDLVREAMRMTGIGEGIEITTLADIPSEGTGLGSSSSVTVGLLNAFHTYRGVLRTREELAREACEIEIDRVGKPIGKQDQYIAAYGGLRMFRFLSDESVETEEICIPEEAKRRLSSRLLLFFSHQTRKSESILEEQRRKTPGMMEPLTRMAKLAERARSSLADGAIEDVGPILHEGWELKRSLVDTISNREIDGMYEAARRAGAGGGKLCGAGGGGFLFLYCDLEYQESVRTALKGYRELQFALARDGTRVIFNIRE
jgi:D-glycero-alpha-D-manno-heptose-7-phosphate kinase